MRSGFARMRAARNLRLPGGMLRNLLLDDRYRKLAWIAISLALVLLGACQHNPTNAGGGGY
jgi:hypothetical protein